jgi:hypothetical protein
MVIIDGTKMAIAVLEVRVNHPVIAFVTVKNDR